jgi:hypothetical protein
MSTTSIDYWSVMEPAFEAVSIYDGHRVYAEQVAKFPPHVRNLLAAHWCQSEVCNGGLNQFSATRRACSR